MDTLLKISCGGGHRSVFQPGEHGMRWLGLEILRLEAGANWKARSGAEEAALVVLSGCCAISIESAGTMVRETAGARADVFSGPPAAAYAPRASEIEVRAESLLEMAVVKARCDADLPPALIAPNDVKVLSAGAANWRRDVRLIVGPGSPISRRLIVGETINPPGNWSGIPPHKHDRVAQSENALEEFYLFKIRPAEAFAVQLLYGDAGEEARVVGHDHVVLLRNGYHPTVAAPGATVFYLWALAGDSKSYDVVADPRFTWVACAEAVLKETHRH